MRVEYNLGLEDVPVPTFSVEATEGPHKLFQLTTLVLNVLADRDRVDVIFHSPNQNEVSKKIDSFEKIIRSAPEAPEMQFKPGNSGSLGSSYYSWISIHSSGAGA